MTTLFVEQPGCVKNVIQVSQPSEYCFPEILFRFWSVLCISSILPRRGLDGTWEGENKGNSQKAELEGELTEGDGVTTFILCFRGTPVKCGEAATAGTILPSISL